MARRKSVRIDKAKQDDSGTAKQMGVESSESAKENRERESGDVLTNCSHVSSLGHVCRDDLVEAQKLSCVGCVSGSMRGRWLCMHSTCLSLSSLNTLCGHKDENHVTQHYQENMDHNVFLNMSNCRLFCMSCEIEIDKEHNKVPIPFELRRVLMPLKRGRRKSSRKSSTEPANIKDSKIIYEQVESETRGARLDKMAVQNRAIIKELEDVFEDDFPRGLTGLQNLGNTCYFNAAVQALSSCTPFSDYFRDKGDLRPFALREPLVSNQMALLIQRLWSPERATSISPKALLTRVREMFPQFRGWNQQDSQELVRCLLELIHRELGQPVYGYEEKLSLATKAARRNSSTSSENSEFFETADSGWSSDGDTPSTSNDSRATKEGERRGRLKVKDSSSRVSPIGDPVGWRSIVTDVFDGSIESSVTCLTCHSVSTTTETFQDLSLPIPSKEQLDRLAEFQDDVTSPRNGGPAQNAASWYSWWAWIGSFSSLFVSPAISLDDCLSTFFSPDRLIGDDMYSCEKCKKLRNGVKACRIRRAPEVLSIHVKRFRHDSYSSSKVSTKVVFPLTDLDISRFCAEDEECLYDLCGFITHEGGGADSGHYLAYCRNEVDGNWYEFDDSTVTKLDSAYVLTKEAYVLFYQKKASPTIERVRSEVSEYLSPTVTAKMTHHSYISSEWLLRLSTFSEPGPVSNYSFLCHHGHILPRRADHIGQLCTTVPAVLADRLYQMFGGGPRVDELHYCLVCDKRWRWLKEKKIMERKKYREVDEAIRGSLYARQSNILFIDHLPPLVINRQWFQAWEKFVSEPCAEPPGPIDNTPLLVAGPDGTLRLKPKSSFIRLHREQFLLFRMCYGGGPEVYLLEGAQPSESEQERMISEAEEAVARERDEAEKKLSSL